MSSLFKMRAFKHLKLYNIEALYFLGEPKKISNPFHVQARFSQDLGNKKQVKVKCKKIAAWTEKKHTVPQTLWWTTCFIIKIGKYIVVSTIYKHCGRRWSTAAHHLP